MWAPSCGRLRVLHVVCACCVCEDVATRFTCADGTPAQRLSSPCHCSVALLWGQAERAQAQVHVGHCQWCHCSDDSCATPTNNRPSLADSNRLVKRGCPVPLAAPGAGVEASAPFTLVQPPSDCSGCLSFAHAAAQGGTAGGEAQPVLMDAVVDAEAPAAAGKSAAGALDALAACELASVDGSGRLHVLPPPLALRVASAPALSLIGMSAARPHAERFGPYGQPQASPRLVAPQEV
jgi:hypothetical protein